MLVQCPNCKTTYKVADDVLKGAAPVFRCSRCRHTFELESEAPQDPVPERVDDPSQQVPPPVQDPELSFSFPARDVGDAETESAQSESTAPAGGHAGEMLIHDQWSIDRAETKDGGPFTISETPMTAPPQGVQEEGKDFSDENAVGPRREEDEAETLYKVLPMASYMDQQASVLPYLTLFGLLAIGFSLLAVISHAHPKASESVVKNIPLIGASVLKNSHLKNGIVLHSLRGGYQSIQGNREVFVITGVAVNQNPVVIREIQIAGKVYNAAGKELEQQMIWVGNTLSSKIIRGMTPEDFPLLQSLKPLKSFELPPGDSIPFAIVFLKATKSTRDFTCEVALAEGEA